MSALLDDWTVASELERKVVETTASLLSREERGEISTHALATGLRSLNDATRGLIDQEINFGIDEHITKLEENSPQAALMLNGNGSGYLVRRPSRLSENLSVWKVRIAGDREVIKSSDATEPHVAAHRKFLKLITKLEGKYRRVI